MSKSLAVVLCAAATLALSGCPFDKTPEPKAQQPIGAAMGDQCEQFGRDVI